MRLDIGFDDDARYVRPERTPARTPEREPQKNPEPLVEQGPLDRRVQELKEQAGQSRFPEIPRRHYERKQAPDLPNEREERRVRSRHHLQPDITGLRLHREERTLLGETGRFRVISVKDAARAIYAGHERALRSDLRFLENKDLVSVDIVNAAAMDDLVLSNVSRSSLSLGPEKSWPEWVTHSLRIRSFITD